MKYEKVAQGSFIKRINRFIAEVEIDGCLERVHVRTTGRCSELFVEGVPCYLERSKNNNRKTAYSLVAVEKEGFLVNTDSHIPNGVVEEALLNGEITGFEGLKMLKREVTKGHSRFDFYYETLERKGYIEVKGVTLEIGGRALFPDAPTSRGRKHVEQLAALEGEGFNNMVLFLVQMEGVRDFSINSANDPDFDTAIAMAAKKGVEIMVYGTIVMPDEIKISNRMNWIQGVSNETEKC